MPRKAATTKKKTATKKASAKKTAAKKKTTTAKKKAPTKKKAAAKKPLTKAEGSSAFWVTDGRVLHDMIELLDALQEMADQNYDYHALGEQNDFSQWVEHVLCDGNCAKSLGKAKNRKNAVTIVKRHLKVYSL